MWTSFSLCGGPTLMGRRDFRKIFFAKNFAPCTICNVTIRPAKLFVSFMAPSSPVCSKLFGGNRTSANLKLRVERVFVQARCRHETFRPCRSVDLYH